MIIKLRDEKNYITFSNEKFKDLDFVEVQINGEYAIVNIPVDELMAAAVSFLTRKNAKLIIKKNDNQKIITG